MHLLIPKCIYMDQKSTCGFLMLCRMIYHLSALGNMLWEELNALLSVNFSVHLFFVAISTYDNRRSSAREMCYYTLSNTIKQ